MKIADFIPTAATQLDELDQVGRKLEHIADRVEDRELEEAIGAALGGVICAKHVLAAAVARAMRLVTPGTDA